MKPRSVFIFALSVLGASGAIVRGAHAQQQQPPNGGPPNGQRPQPPQEAFTACANASAGASCTVNFHGRTITGTCAQFTDSRLFCRPEGMPPPPDQR